MSTSVVGGPVGHHGDAVLVLGPDHRLAFLSSRYVVFLSPVLVLQVKQDGVAELHLATSPFLKVAAAKFSAGDPAWA